ncbi:exported hypothetical protein [Vibrio aestuarianus]|nr:exported hypothetical protein [Vibrio aestuarianus]
MVSLRTLALYAAITVSVSTAGTVHYQSEIYLSNQLRDLPPVEGKNYSSIYFMFLIRYKQT